MQMQTCNTTYLGNFHLYTAVSLATQSMSSLKTHASWQRATLAEFKCEVLKVAESLRNTICDFTHAQRRRSEANTYVEPFLPK